MVQDNLAETCHTDGSLIKRYFSSERDRATNVNRRAISIRYFCVCFFSSLLLCVFRISELTEENNSDKDCCRKIQ